MSQHLLESCLNASLIRSWWFQYLLIFLFIYTWTFTICHTRWMSANHFFLISCKSHTSINVLVLKPETCTVRMVSNYDLNDWIRYESSGYDDTFFRRGYSNSSPFRPAFSSPNESSSELHASATAGSASHRQGASQQQVWSLAQL